MPLLQHPEKRKVAAHKNEMIAAQSKRKSLLREIGSESLTASGFEPETPELGTSDEQHSAGGCVADPASPDPCSPSTS